MITSDASKVDAPRRATIHSLGKGFWQVVLHYGFMDAVNVPRICGKHARHLREWISTT